VLPLPTVFSGTELLTGGLNAPLYFVSRNQLTAQLPNELASNRSFVALVISNGLPSLPQEINLVSATPGTAATPDGRLIAQHADFSLVDSSRPARPGEDIAVYLVGLGATTPPVPSGSPAPANPLARVTANVTVTVDGQSADVGFAGLTPGAIGLYQINFRVPPGAKAGNLDVVITQDGAVANAAKLTVAP
jgi:uncharacterized protein (TIGR03437 family)